MGFISVAECEALRNNALINRHMAQTAAQLGVPRYFFSSSVCVYRDMEPDEPPLTDQDVIQPDSDNERGFSDQEVHRELERSKHPYHRWYRFLWQDVHQCHVERVSAQKANHLQQG
jgi:nucleoside-diphosphate-sugar epimerase